jgi:hypothetical protein
MSVIIRDKFFFCTHGLCLMGIYARAMSILLLFGPFVSLLWLVYKVKEADFFLCMVPILIDRQTSVVVKSLVARV